MKNKILIFSVGLFAGLTIGVLFSVAIKAVLAQMKELHISLNKINLQQNQLSQRLDSIQGKLVPDTKRPDNSTTKNNSKTSASVNSTKIREAEKTSDSQDTINSDETASNNNNDSDIIVMTNQLVSVLSVPLVNKDTVTINSKAKKTDSTLAAMSEVSNSIDISTYRIEFWKSPLNYKGYKMSQGKIIIYGINPVTPVNLILEEDSYYFLVNQSVYKFDFTDDYKPFEKVTDKNLLKKLGYAD